VSVDAIGLVMLSAVLHVSWNFLAKASADPKSFLLLAGVVTVAVTAVALAFAPVEAISMEVWVFIVISGLMHALYVYALSSAYETGDVSFVYPIARSAPAFVPLLAYWVFGETLTPLAIVGIGLVTVGLFLLQMRGDTLAQQWRNLTKFLHRRDSLWAFITLASVIAYTLNDKAGMVAFSHVDPQIDLIAALWRGPVYFLLVNTISYVCFYLVLVIGRKRIRWGMWKSEWKRVVITVIGSFLSYSLILYVLQTEPVSLVAAFRQSSILFAVVAGWLFLKEPHGALRLAAAVGMLIGLTLVVAF